MGDFSLILDASRRFSKRISSLARRRRKLLGFMTSPNHFLLRIGSFWSLNPPNFPAVH